VPEQVAKNLITKAEVADLVGRSQRWVELNQRHFNTTPVYDGENGRPTLAYDVNSLPGAAQLRWIERQLPEVIQLVPANPVPGQLSLALTTAVGPNLSAEDRQEAERRYSVIEPLIESAKHRALWLQCANSKGKLIELLSRQHQTKPRNVYRWLKGFDSGGLAALVPKDRSDKGQPRALNSAALDFLVAAALPCRGNYGELSVRETYRAYGEERAWRAAHANTPLGEFELRKYVRYLDPDGQLLPQAQLPAASYKTFVNWFHRIPDVVKVMAREGEEAFHNTQEILSFRAIADIRPLDYVVMDHRRLDIFALSQERGAWKLLRPWLTAAIDMRTRKWLAWAIVENPSSDSIASVLKRSFIDWGLPVAVYWDNGKDFTCEWLEGKRLNNRQAAPVHDLEPALRGVLQTLEVRVHHAIVRRARSKIIEPNFGNVANFDKTLPWWCGHKPTARPERFAELIDQHEAWLAGKRGEPAFPTMEEVVATYDEFLSSLNEREHSGEGMRKITATGRGWMCPNECWEREIPKVIRRSVPAEVLQFCFAKRCDLTVRNGEICRTLRGQKYHYRLADSQLRLMSLNGCDVQLAYDPFDLGTGALYHQARFVGLVHCVELRRMGEQAFVQDERDRRAARREVKRFIETVHRAVPVADHNERAARRQATRPLRIEPARVETPAAIAESVSHAAEAARADRGFSFATPGEELIAVANRSAYQDDKDEDRFEFFSSTTKGDN
jgi:hypothetical protein